MPISAGASEQDLELYLTGFFRGGKDSVLDAHIIERGTCVIHSVKSGDDFIRGPAAPGFEPGTHNEREMRSERGFVTNDSALLQILSPFSEDHLRVCVVYVSKNGLGVHMPLSVMPGSRVKIKMKHYIAFGESRYCVVAPKGFLVGIQLHDSISTCIPPASTRPEDVIDVESGASLPPTEQKNVKRFGTTGASQLRCLAPGDRALLRRE
jgi:hypothetical protein